MGTSCAVKRPERRGGFSLIELMIVLLLAGAVLAIGAPSFGDFLRNNRLTAAGNDFIGAANLARTEAIKRQSPVALCSTSQPNNPAAQCNAGDFTGWIAFEDRNADCVHDNGEPVLRVAGPLDPSIANGSDGGCLSYAGTGFAQTIAGVVPLTRVIFCDSRGLELQAGSDMSAARAIQISRSGRAQLTRNIGVINGWGMPCSTN
jgi:type IV fimbrial biogenesis protein FimT